LSVKPEAFLRESESSPSTSKPVPDRSLRKLLYVMCLLQAVSQEAPSLTKILSTELRSDVPTVGKDGVAVTPVKPEPSPESVPVALKPPVI